MMRIGRRGLLKRAIAAVLALPLVGRALTEQAEAAPASVVGNDGDQLSAAGIQDRKWLGLNDIEPYYYGAMREAGPFLPSGFHPPAAEPVVNQALTEHAEATPVVLEWQGSGMFVEGAVYVLDDKGARCLRTLGADELQALRERYAISQMPEDALVEQRAAEARSLGYQEPQGDSGFSVVQYIESPGYQQYLKAWQDQVMATYTANPDAFWANLEASIPPALRAEDA